MRAGQLTLDIVSEIFSIMIAVCYWCDGESIR